MTADSPAAVEARQLRKTFIEDGEPVEAVRGVDLEVPEGELLAVMGPSGCGKSTLLHLLGGLARPTQGEVFVGGRALAGLGDDDLAEIRRREVGFVFQAYNLVPVLTVEENVSLPALIAGESRSTTRARVDELLHQVGLETKRNRRPAQLSGGEQQRVAIARALIQRPAVILADEPTGNLDSQGGRQVLTLLRQLHEAGQTIVLVTHDSRIASQAQRILFLRDGEVVNELRPKDEGSRALARIIDLEAD
jgi:putative ABC transport system ATP-binding protein